MCLATYVHVFQYRCNDNTKSSHGVGISLAQVSHSSLPFVAT